MKHKTLFLIILTTSIACNNNEPHPVHISKPASDTTFVNNKFSAVDSTKIKDSIKAVADLRQLISVFSEREFRDNRKQLIAEGEEHQYQISDIKKLGTVLKYDVVIPGIEGKMEYTCNPERGEITITTVGDKDVAQVLYKQSKVGLTWDNCNKIDGAEKCDTYQDMTAYPLKTHFTASIVNYDKLSIYTFRRVIMPK